MSNVKLQKLREWVWPWPWTFNALKNRRFDSFSFTEYGLGEWQHLILDKIPNISVLELRVLGAAWFKFYILFDCHARLCSHFFSTQMLQRLSVCQFVCLFVHSIYSKAC